MVWACACMHTLPTACSLACAQTCCSPPYAHHRLAHPPSIIFPCLTHACDRRLTHTTVVVGLCLPVTPRDNSAWRTTRATRTWAPAAWLTPATPTLRTTRTRASPYPPLLLSRSTSSSARRRPASRVFPALRVCGLRSWTGGGLGLTVHDVRCGICVLTVL